MREIENIDQLLALRDEYKKKVQTCGEELLLKEFNKFFAASPEIESVSWTQYTPSFNDGDPCVFTVGDLLYRTQEDAKAVESGEYEEGNSDYSDAYRDCCWYGEDAADLSKATKKNLTGFESLLQDSYDILQLIFEDGSRITATKDKIEAESYDCGY